MGKILVLLWAAMIPIAWFAIVGSSVPMWFLYAYLGVTVILTIINMTKDKAAEATTATTAPRSSASSQSPVRTQHQRDRNYLDDDLLDLEGDDLVDDLLDMSELDGSDTLDDLVESVVDEIVDDVRVPAYQAENVVPLQREEPAYSPPPAAEPAYDPPAAVAASSGGSSDSGYSSSGSSDSSSSSSSDSGSSSSSDSGGSD